MTSDNGDSWTEASRNLPLVADIGNLAISPSDPNRMALIDSRPNILVSSDAGANWTKAGEGPLYGNNSLRIRSDRTNPDRPFVSRNNPRAEQQHIWTSTDTGATRTAISKTGETNGLPDVPINSLEMDPLANNGPSQDFHAPEPSDGQGHAGSQLRFWRVTSRIRRPSSGGSADLGSACCRPPYRLWRAWPPERRESRS